VLAALSAQLRHLEAAGTRVPDPDDAELERLVAPVRDAIRELTDELERRHLAE
jgi:hypothetical protein